MTLRSSRFQSVMWPVERRTDSPLSLCRRTLDPTCRSDRSIASSHIGGRFKIRVIDQQCQYNAAGSSCDRMHPNKKASGRGLFISRLWRTAMWTWTVAFVDLEAPNQGVDRRTARNAAFLMNYGGTSNPASVGHHELSGGELGSDPGVLLAHGDRHPLLELFHAGEER